MRSVMHVEVGLPKFVPSGIHIPMGLTVSDDDDDDSLPVPGYTWMNAFVSHETIAKGPDFIKESALNLLTDYRLTYASSGFAKIAAALLDFIDKTDLSVYNVGWFPDPLTTTVH